MGQDRLPRPSSALLSVGGTGRKKFQAYLGCFEVWVNSTEHVESESGCLTRTRLTLSDQVSCSVHDPQLSTPLDRFSAYGLLSSIGRAFSWIFDGFLKPAPKMPLSRSLWLRRLS
jgi:hypothetical protein